MYKSDKDNLIYINLISTVLSERTMPPVEKFGRDILKTLKGKLYTGRADIVSQFRLGYMLLEDITPSTAIWESKKFQKNTQILEDKTGIDLPSYKTIKALQVMLFEGLHNNELNVIQYNKRLNGIIRDCVQICSKQGDVQVMLPYSEEHDFYGQPYSEIVRLFKGYVNVFNEEGASIELLTVNIDGLLKDED